MIRLFVLLLTNGERYLLDDRAVKRGIMGRLHRAILESGPVQIFTTCIVYCLYAILLGISLIPSILILYSAAQVLMPIMGIRDLILISLCCGGAVFAYFLTGTLVLALSIRVLSFGIQPGRYSTSSLTMIRWLVYSGIYQIAGTTILAHVPMGFLVTAFFKIVGAKIGKNVRINTWSLNDAYLLDIGDNVIIGGKTDISCHTFEKGQLLLQRVHIGEGTLIGQGCYISPGVSLGKECVVGQFSFIRKGKTIPSNTTVSGVAALPIRETAKIEHLSETLKILQNERASNPV